jgi:hypothetical protein
LLNAVRELLLVSGLSPDNAARIIEHVQNTHDVSPIDVYVAYVRRLEVEITREEIEWARAQRGAYIHAGEVDAYRDARRDAFRKAIGRVLHAELTISSGGGVPAVPE